MSTWPEGRANYPHEVFTGEVKPPWDEPNKLCPCGCGQHSSKFQKLTAKLARFYTGQDLDKSMLRETQDEGFGEPELKE